MHNINICMQKIPRFSSFLCLLALKLADNLILYCHGTIIRLATAQTKV